MRFLPFILILILSMQTAASCSCSKEESSWELGDGPKRDITLKFDWGNLKTGETVPTGIKIVLFSETKQTVLIKDIEPKDFTIKIPDGEYKLLVFNNDVPSIAFDRLNDYNKASAYLKPSSETKAGENGDVMEAMSFYAANIPGLTTGTGSLPLFTLQMVPLTKTIEIKINSLFINEIESCNATLTNISPRVNLSTHEPDNSMQAYYRFDVKNNGNGFDSKKQVFGIINPSTCVLNLEYKTKEGVEGTITIPVGEALLNINSTTISAVTLDLEFVKMDMGGMTATLKNWTESIIRDEDVI